MQSTAAFARYSPSDLAENACAKIDRVIADRSVLKHPFYQAWQAGTLSKDALADYAAQYYHHVSAFPTYLSALHSQTSDASTRRVILENLIDEERGEENHPELWLRFAEGVGCERSVILATQALPQTVETISIFKRNTGGGSVAAGIAALYAYESQMPAVSKTKMQGLRRYYGIEDSRTLAYFRVHAEADVKHSAEERELLAKHITSPADAAEAIESTKEITGAIWDLLSDVWLRQ